MEQTEQKDQREQTETITQQSEEEIQEESEQHDHDQNEHEHKNETKTIFVMEEECETRTALDQFGFFGSLLKVGLVIITYCLPLIILLIYTSFNAFIYDSFARVFSPTTVKVILVLQKIEIFCVLYHWYKAVFTKPTIVPYDYFKYLLKPGEDVPTCKFCKVPKYPRTHHCRICGKCMVGMDHHCSWLGCIGIHNIRHFHLILGHITYSIGVYGYMIICNLIYDKDPSMYFKTHVVLLVLMFNVFMSTGAQFAFYTLMLSINGTMLDAMDTLSYYRDYRQWKLPQYCRSFRENWRIMYMCREDVSFFWYLLPYTPSFKKNSSHED